jgi:hypothetical protein
METKMQKIRTEKTVQCALDVHARLRVVLEMDATAQEKLNRQ